MAAGSSSTAVADVLATGSVSTVSDAEGAGADAALASGSGLFGAEVVVGLGAAVDAPTAAAESAGAAGAAGVRVARKLPTPMTTTAARAAHRSRPSRFFIGGAYESGGWDGVAGGDAWVQIAPGRPDAMTVVGDWDGDGRDQLARFEPGFPRFLLDLDGDGAWRGVAGGDRRVDFPPADPPSLAEPFADDFDGAPGDGVGLGDDWRLLADLDEDGAFEDEAGGDLHLQLVIPLAFTVACLRHAAYAAFPRLAPTSADRSGPVRGDERA